MNQSNIIDEVTLYYRNGSSDKVYKVTITKGEGGYMVDGWNGRRGDSLKQRPQTKSPVSLDEARRLYDRLVKKKKNDRDTPYSEGQQITNYIPPPGTANRAVDQCLLLTAVEEPSLIERLLSDNDYAAQQKFDGDRLILTAEPAGTIIGYNRTGKPRAIPETILQDAARFFKAAGPFMIDGELIGDQYFAFDLLEQQEDHRAFGFESRYRLLKASYFELTIGSNSNIQIAQTYFHTDSKRHLLASQQAAGEEGIVFKPIDAPYLPGRQANHFKYKLTAEASILILRLNQKASVAMGVFDESGNVVEVGNCTIRDRSWTLSEGDIIDVRYLYAYRGGSLFQPRMLRKRSDLQASACSISQLRYKQESLS